MVDRDTSRGGQGVLLTAQPEYVGRTVSRPWDPQAGRSSISRMKPIAVHVGASQAAHTHNEHLASEKISSVERSGHVAVAEKCR